jgi:tetratricopeptide (TPR) repeat protein
LGSSLYVLGNYPLALDYSLQALTLAEKIHDSTSIVNSSYSLGSIYRDIGDYKHGLYYIYRGKTITEKLSDKNAVLVSLGIIGSIYDKSNQIDSALICLNQASQLDSTINSKLTQGFIQYSLGNIYHEKGNYRLAIEYYRKSIDLAISSNIIKDLMDSWNGISKTFFKTRQVDSAIFYSRQVLFEGRSTAYPFGSLEASSVLSDIYRSQNMLDSSDKYNEIAVSIKDSIFNKERITQFQNLSFSEDLRKQEIDAAQSEYVNKIKIYILSGGLAILLLMAVMLLRNNRHKQKAYALLQKQKQEIDIQKAKVEETLEELRNTQAQLIQSEKMASLGELTAGIAHEIQNPLNFVNNFSEVNSELIDELDDEAQKGNIDEVKSIAKDIKENSEKINHHGKRADAIVKGMLQHSRQAQGKKNNRYNALSMNIYASLSWSSCKRQSHSMQQ